MADAEQECSFMEHCGAGMALLPQGTSALAAARSIRLRVAPACTYQVHLPTAPVSCAFRMLLSNAPFTGAFPVRLSCVSLKSTFQVRLSNPPFKCARPGINSLASLTHTITSSTPRILVRRQRPVRAMHGRPSR
eukprot:360103-Chlamydomonas_euryale.AAC.1